MKKWLLIQAELGAFHRRGAVLVFALKMSFVATMLSMIVIAALMPVLFFFGGLPLPMADVIRLGVGLSWLVGGTVSGVLALLAGYAIHELTVSRAEFERLSRTDTLSGLFNRRAFTEVLNDTEENASLVIFDLDRFKTINDRFGHTSGDAVLVAVSRLLSELFDGDSLVARLGGEEFGAIVRGGSIEERLVRIEHAAAAISSEGIAIEGGKVQITVSAGVADFGEGRNKEAVYTAADKALYLAKALGRNRVVHESEGLLHGLRRWAREDRQIEPEGGSDEPYYGHGI